MPDCRSQGPAKHFKQREVPLRVILDAMQHKNFDEVTLKRIGELKVTANYDFLLRLVSECVHDDNRFQLASCLSDER